MKFNNRLKGVYAATPSVALFASLFLVGISRNNETMTSAYGATLQDMADDSMMTIAQGSSSNMSDIFMIMAGEQNLTETSIPVMLPLTPGYSYGHEVFYISTRPPIETLLTL